MVPVKELRTDTNCQKINEERTMRARALHLNPGAHKSVHMHPSIFLTGSIEKQEKAAGMIEGVIVINIKRGRASRCAS